MTTVSIEVNLDDFNNDELIDEIESRGFHVVEDNPGNDHELLDDEVDWLQRHLLSLNMAYSDPDYVTVHRIYQKLLKK